MGEMRHVLDSVNELVDLGGLVQEALCALCQVPPAVSRPGVVAEDDECDGGFGSAYRAQDLQSGAANELHVEDDDIGVLGQNAFDRSLGVSAAPTIVIARAHSMAATRSRTIAESSARNTFTGTGAAVMVVTVAARPISQHRSATECTPRIASESAHACSPGGPSDDSERGRSPIATAPVLATSDERCANVFSRASTTCRQRQEQAANTLPLVAKVARRGALGSDIYMTMNELFGGTGDINPLQECARAVLMFAFGLLLVRLAAGASSAGGGRSTSSSRSASGRTSAAR
jgi:hypothetical protein